MHFPNTRASSEIKLGKTFRCRTVINKNVAYMRFEADKDIMEALVHIKNKTGVGRRGEATAGEPALANSFWGMLYADDAGVISESPEQLRKIMGTIVVMCAAFGLIESQAKTEIMRLRTRGMPASTTIFSVEAAGQVYNQTDEFAYLGGNVSHIADLSIEVDWRMRNAWCSIRKHTSFILYDRPSAPLERVHGVWLSRTRGQD